MNYSIENAQLSVTVSSFGAELQNLVCKQTGVEYMWSGDPDFWGKKSPVLFPIVGALKNNTYFLNHNSYQLGRHGFAREKEFELKQKTRDSLLFMLKSDDESLKIYPFEFEFLILYKIFGRSLKVTYTVKNTGKDSMCFSVGGHPAFKAPIFESDRYEDYILKFEKNETTGRWPITKEGLIGKPPTPLLNDESVLKLKKELFYTDAIVLKNLISESVSLLSTKQNRGIRFDFPGFSYLGIWAAKDADFVCIEPWCGIADSEDTNQSIINKEGINKLCAGAFFERAWTVSLIEK